MADVSMSAQVTRIDSMEEVTYCTKISGGLAMIQETDFIYQGSYSISRKNPINSDQGFYSTGAAGPYNVSTASGTYQVFLFKVMATNNLALKTGSSGLRNRIGSDPTAYYEYNQFGGDNYPFRGGWQIVAVDPNISGYRDATVGSPDLTAADFFAIMADFTSNSKSENLVFDAIDVGNGLTLVGGDGASADGSFQDFVDYDEGTQANRWGFVHTYEDVIVVYGTLVIGGATATEFTDADQQIVFPDGKFPAGWTGLKFDLQNASTVINLDRIVMIGKGNETTTDTRPDFVVTGANGSMDIDYCFFINFRNITLSAGVTFDGNNIVGGSETLTQNGATIANNIFDKPVKSAGEAFVISDTPNLISGCEFYSGGAGHAIEITDAGTYTFQNNIFVDYGANDTNNASIYNNSGGHVTLNVTGCSGITVRNGSGATTTVNQVVLLTINVEDEDGDPIQGAAVAIYKTDGTQLMNEYTTSGGVAEESYSYVADTDVTIRVRKSSSGGTRYFPLETADVIDSSGLKATVVLIKDNIASA